MPAVVKKHTDDLSGVTSSVTKVVPIGLFFLGVNDVEHGAKGTTPEDYRSGLEKMIAMAQQAGAVAVLCTPGTVGERKLGTNRCDKGMDEYAGIVRDLAKQNKLALCDIRKAMFDYLAEGLSLDYLAEGLSLDYFLETFEGVAREDAQTVLRHGGKRISAELLE